MLLMLAVAIGLIVRAIIKNSVDGKDPLDPVEEDDKPKVDEEALAEMKRIIETDVERLLRLAREAAARGDYEAGVELAYAASLRRLEGQALIDMHESRTNGDYVRGLRRSNPDLARALREVARDVERVQFGSRVADAALFQSLMNRVMGIVGRAMAVALFCLTMGSNLSCVEETVGPPPAEQAFLRGGYAPTGSRAILEILRSKGKDASYREKGLDDLDSGGDAIIILPGGGPDDDEGWDELFDWASEDQHLLILAGLIPPKKLLAIDIIDSGAAEDELFGAGEFAYAMSSLSTPVPTHTALDVSSAFASPLLVRDYPASEVYAAKREFSDGTVMIFADMQLFTNVAMAAGDNAELMLLLFENHYRIELVDPWIETGSKNPIESMANAKMTPLLLQILALMVLFLLWKGRAFGTLRDAVEEKRRSFADHVRALGLQYARARASNHALGAYSHWAIERLRDRVPRGKQRSIEELSEMLAARAGMPASAVHQVLSQAQAASDSSAPRSFRVNSVRGEGAQPAVGGNPYVGAGPYGGAPVAVPARVEEIRLLRQLNELMAAVAGSTSRNKKPKQPKKQHP